MVSFELSKEIEKDFFFLHTARISNVDNITFVDRNKKDEKKTNLSLI